MDQPAEFLASLRAALRAPASVDTSVGVPVLEWLSIAPMWPEEIVVRGLLATNSATESTERAQAALAAAVEAGWVAYVDMSLPHAGKMYCMSAAQRRRALQRLRAPRSDAPPAFLVAQRAYRQIQRSSVEDLPPLLLLWRELLTDAPDENAVAFALERAVDGVLREAYELGLETSPAAADILSAAEPLALVIGGPIRVGYSKAQRAIELHERRSQDGRYLKNYLGRQKLDRAFRRLLDDDECWALHYVGVGGAGKTMFLRHLQSQRMPQVVTARVDFDHLNPSYPLRSPGLLLLSFAEELKLEAPDLAIDYFAKLSVQVARVHAELDTAQRAARDVPVGLDAPGFDFCLKIFADALRQFASIERVPLLILDTCEELARMRGDGSVPRAVVETFRILEKLHEELPSLRVVFAGRRALASSGNGWTWQNEDLPVRPYLRVCAIRGFQHDEALTMLRSYGEPALGAGGPIPAELHESILALSLAPQGDDFAGLLQPGDDDAGAGIVRYNPYDVALYAGWAASDSTLTKARLRAAGRHHYVRERIVARVREELAVWLPHLTLLRRFDVEVLGELTELREDIAPLWREIREQEWTHLDRHATETSDAPTTFWSVDEKLRQKLQAYFAEELPTAWTDARQRVTAVLEKITVEREFSRLAPEYFDVLCQTLRSEPQRLVRWWARIEDKLLATGAWEWADRLTARLLNSEPGAVGETGGQHPLEAAVRALRAHLQLRAGGRAEPLDVLWREVSLAIVAHPDPRERALLTFRAAAGVAANLRYALQSSEHDTTALHDCLRGCPSLRSLREEFAPAIAPERFVRQALNTEMALLDHAVEVLERCGMASKSAEASAQLVLTRIHELELAFGPDPAARTVAAAWLSVWLHRVLSLFPQQRTAWQDTLDPAWSSVDPRATQPTALCPPAFDWIPPGDVERRRLLEGARLAEAWEHADQRGLGMGSEWLAHYAFQDLRMPKTLDADRALSQVLRLGVSKLPPIESLLTLVQSSVAVAQQTEQCEAHRAVPPLFVTVLQRLAAAGAVDTALQVITAARSASVSVSESGTRWLDRIASELNQRFRLAAPAVSIPIPALGQHVVEPLETFFKEAEAALAKLESRELRARERTDLERAAQRACAHLGFNLPRRSADLEKIPPGWLPWFARYLLLQSTSAEKAERDKVRQSLLDLYPNQLPSDILFLNDEDIGPPRSFWERQWVQAAGFALLVVLLRAGYQLFSAQTIASMWEFVKENSYYFALALGVVVYIAFIAFAVANKYSLRAIGRLAPLLVKPSWSVAQPEPGSFLAEYEVNTILSRRDRYQYRFRLPAATEPYASAAAAVPRLAEVIIRKDGVTRSDTSIQTLFKNEVGMRLPCPLVTEWTPDLAEPCWEAMLTFPRSADFANNTLEVRRKVTRRGGSVGTFAGEMTLCCLSAQRELSFSEDILENSAIKQRFLRALPEERDRSVGVLFLQAEVSVYERQLRLLLEPSAGSGIGTSDIRRVFPELRVLVLIAPDRRRLGQRGATDRLTASHLRIAGAELALSCAPAVICVPSLPSETPLLREGLDKICRVIARRQAKASVSLGSAVRELRDAIFEQCGLEPEDAAELANDVCFYGVDTLDLRVGEARPDEVKERAVSA